jgi:hypothetical protein
VYEYDFVQGSGETTLPHALDRNLTGACLRRNEEHFAPDGARNNFVQRFYKHFAATRLFTEKERREFRHSFSFGGAFR